MVSGLKSKKPFIQITNSFSLAIVSLGNIETRRSSQPIYRTIAIKVKFQSYIMNFQPPRKLVFFVLHKSIMNAPGSHYIIIIIKYI